MAVVLPPKFSASSVEKNGMKVKWEYKADRIHFEMQAPTEGWLAIGFNEENQLTGTNLIMGAVEADRIKMADDYIVSFGNPRTVESLGGRNQIEDAKGQESDGKTKIAFSLPIRAADQFHFNLDKGKTYHLLIAYSQVDDFAHHSIMRTSVEIKL